MEACSFRASLYSGARLSRPDYLLCKKSPCMTKKGFRQREHARYKRNLCDTDADDQETMSAQTQTGRHSCKHIPGIRAAHGYYENIQPIVGDVMSLRFMLQGKMYLGYCHVTASCVWSWSICRFGERLHCRTSGGCIYQSPANSSVTLTSLPLCLLRLSRRPYHHGLDPFRS